MPQESKFVEAGKEFCRGKTMSLLPVPTVHRGRSRGFWGLAQPWWVWHGLAGLCICVGDGGKHIKVPIKSLFFSTKKEQNLVFPLCHWEMWDCLFRPVQQSPLCSPLRRHHTEMFPSLTVRCFVASRTLSCSLCPTQEVAWTEQPMQADVRGDITSCIIPGLHPCLFTNLCSSAWALLCCDSFILLCVWACFWLHWKAYGFSVLMQMIKLTLWVTIFPPCCILLHWFWSFINYFSGITVSHILFCAKIWNHAYSATFLQIGNEFT